MNFDTLLGHIPMYLPEDECWEYQGSLDGCGYGFTRTAWKGPTVKAHRVMYELYNDYTLQPKEVVRHTCDNPSCCNPHHLIKGTQADNVRDCIERGRFPNRAGECNGRAKINEQLVKDIRMLFECGT